MAASPSQVRISTSAARTSTGSDSGLCATRRQYPCDAAIAARTSASGASGASAVSAHRLLGSSAVVSMGIGTLLNVWDRLPPDEREWLLHRMAARAASVDDGLKRIAGGFEPGIAGADFGPAFFVANFSFAGHNEIHFRFG